MKKIILSFMLLTCTIGLLFAERDFCGRKEKNEKT